MYTVQTKNSLKLEIYDFCTNKQCENYTTPIELPKWNSLSMFFVHTNNVQAIKKPIQLANWNGLCMFFAHTNNAQTIQNLYN